MQWVDAIVLVLMTAPEMGLEMETMGMGMGMEVLLMERESQLV